MIKSMTGFGKGVVDFKDARISVELKTFNHKFFELSCKLPQNLQPIEEQIKKEIKKKVRRGKLYLWVNCEQTYDKSLDIKLDEKKLKRYYTLLKNAKKKFNLKGDITLSQILSLPEVIISEPKKENKKILWRSTFNALEKAINKLISMRRKEGAALNKELLLRVSNITKSVLRIKIFLPKEINKYKQNLKRKVGKAYDKNGVLRERIETDVALFAKNCDITEELTRISAHLVNFKNTLKSPNEVGKVLDFIAQELHRETNTVGSKSSDFQISKEVIFIKGEVEKIREQVQNIE
ncbi:MAG: YicC family protein [Candidatus Omnitrophica bacterium]|nr:YicC family protein [Candidatus Omnitrophota bacterium]